MIVEKFCFLEGYRHLVRKPSFRCRYTIIHSQVKLLVGIPKNVKLGEKAQSEWLKVNDFNNRASNICSLQAYRYITQILYTIKSH